MSLSIFLFAISCSLTLGMERTCMSKMQVIGNRVQITGNVHSILDNVCNVSLHIPTGICWTSILGMSIAYVERRQADAYPNGFANGCQAANDVCAAHVDFVLRKLQDDPADNDGECVCHLFSAICNAGFPHSGECEEDILRLIKDFDAHKMPADPHRRKRDLWDPSCISGKRLWPIKTPENDRAWKEGYDLWTSWALPEEKEKGIEYLSIKGDHRRD